MESEIKHLIGLKVKSVDRDSITFEDGTRIDFHPYETYIYKMED